METIASLHLTTAQKRPMKGLLNSGDKSIKVLHVWSNDKSFESSKSIPKLFLLEDEGVENMVRWHDL